MDRRERSGDPLTAMLAALQGNQSLIWTALPGIIAEKDGGPSFDPAKRTVTIQPAIQALVQSPNGDKAWVTLPLLVDCPVFFPGGGGVTMTFPIRTGDECLVVFSSRCIDSWYQSGGVQNQPMLRMHDLSDGFALVGVSSVPSVIPAISTSKSQWRDDAGTTYIEVDPEGTAIKIITPGDVIVEAGGDMSAEVGGNMVTTVGGDMNADVTGALTVTAAGGATLTAETLINGDVSIIGNLTVSGVILAPVIVAATSVATPLITIAGKNYTTHTHGGVDPGGGTSGPVTP